jgi:hypothetical protein
MLNIIIRRTTGILAPHDWVALTDDYEPGDQLYVEAYGDDPQEALDNLNILYDDIKMITIEHS